MNALSLPAMRLDIIDELYARQSALATYSAVLVAVTAMMLGIQMFDHRLIDDVSVWAKPAKFAFSIALFAATNAWFFGYFRPDRRNARAMRRVVAVMILAGSFELAYITWQGAHGLQSHFNRSSPFYEIMYGLMGIGALALTGTTLPIAWEIARRPTSGMASTYRVSVVIGLLLCFVLGAGFGGYMAQGTGHSVGAVGGHTPVFGWNRSGGDLRIAHFLGIHAQQAIPILGALLLRAPSRMQMPALIVGSTLYIMLAVAVFAQAIAGTPLLPL